MPFAVGTTTISIHAPREGSDVQQDGQDLDAVAISIHAPREGSDQRRQTLPPTAHYFYPRSPRGERQLRQAIAIQHILISIHAPREGSDLALALHDVVCFVISIHAPREGSDATSILFFPGSLLFLSTLPARGATPRPSAVQADRRYFYPRSPRGERPCPPDVCARYLTISIHAPREGSDSASSSLMA